MSQTMGPFEIVSELGRGGMGVVYRARELESGREVALKVILSRLDPRRRARFEREGQLTASLSHVGIVRVHSCGHVDGRPFLAYELVNGQSLDEIMPTVPLRRRVELIRDAARALGYAHSRGVIHRDVKGENILVDEQGHVRVADFGLATAGDLERLTQTGQMLGTPSHMSPEQVDGRAGPVTSASDVWSLGVILYQSLTGQLPFAAATMVEMVGLILTAGFDRPRKVAPEVPAALEQICLHALTIDPKRRYPDGEALAEDLDAWLEGRWKGHPRPLRWAALAAPLVIGLVGWGIASAASGERAQQPPGLEAPPGPVETPAPQLSAGQLDLARSQLEKLEVLPDPRLRARQAERWLGSHRRYPEELRRRAEERLHEAQLEYPLLTIDHAPREGPYRLGGTGYPVRAVFLDDQRLITQGDNMIRCWDLSDPLTPLWEIEAGGKAFDVHPDGRWVVASMSTQRLVVQAIEIETRRTLRVPGLDPNSTAASKVAFSRDGSLLAVGHRYAGALIYRWPELTLVQHVQRAPVQDIALSADGSLVALAGGPYTSTPAKIAAGSNFVAVHRIQSGEQVFLRADFEQSQSAVAFDASGATLVVGDRIGNLLRFSIADPARAEPFVAQEPSAMVHAAALRGGAHSNQVGAIVIDDAGRVTSSDFIPSASQDSEARVWDLSTRKELRLIHLEGGGVINTLALSPDGSKLALGKGNRAVEVFLAGN